MSADVRDYIHQYDIRVVTSEAGEEMCYITRQGENMCFEMSMCEFERWIFYRHGIHIRPKKLGGSVGFLIRDLTPHETLVGCVKEFLAEARDAMTELCPDRGTALIS